MGVVNIKAENPYKIFFRDVFSGNFLQGCFEKTQKKDGFRRPIPEKRDIFFTSAQKTLDDLLFRFLLGEAERHEF